MLLIKSIEVITYLIQEFLCLIAIVLYKAFEYRWLLLTLTFLAVLFLGGLFTYATLTN